MLLDHDMLKGNINRMYVTEDIKELEQQYKWVKCKVDKLYEKRMNELNSK